MLGKYFHNILKVLILMFSVIYMHTAFAVDQNQSTSQQTSVTEPDIWKAIKEGESGIISSFMPEKSENGVLINGDESLIIQANTLRTSYMPYALIVASVGVFVIFLLFFLVNGASKLSHGFANKLIARWSKADLIIHWVMAISCILLIITGIFISIGRHFIAPHIGDSWASLINACKVIHDYAGPVFVIFWAIAIIKWAKKQLPKLYDLKWFLVVGGYINFPPFKGKHPDSGFANAGEKLWFWSLAVFGLLISITGIMLVLPQIEVPRYISTIAILVHGISAAVIIAFSIVHIWMATVLSEGGMECMVTGHCDENWAIQHHNLWYDEIKENGTLRYIE